MSVNVFQTVISNGGGYKSGIPSFTYSGQFLLINDGNNNWRLKLLTSGVLIFTDAGEMFVDIFLVGGGGGGRVIASLTTGAVAQEYYNYYQNGGGGGYTRTEMNQVLQGGVEYTTAIGAGGKGDAWGVNSTSGGSTLFGYYSVQGGFCGVNGDYNTGGNGGSGGAGGGQRDFRPAYSAGGKDGANGSTHGGKGQGSTTREFGEPDGELYSNGGDGDFSGGHAKPYSETNHGHGGHASTDANLVSGQPGIVIIRNHRS